MQLGFSPAPPAEDSIQSSIGPCTRISSNGLFSKAPLIAIVKHTPRGPGSTGLSEQRNNWSLHNGLGLTLPMKHSQHPRAHTIQAHYPSPPVLKDPTDYYSAIASIIITLKPRERDDWFEGWKASLASQCSSRSQCRRKLVLPRDY